MRIDQLVPAYHRGDAIGDTASHLKRFFQSKGFSSEIYCLDCDKELEEQARLFSSFPRSGRNDVCILHFALPSPLTRGFIDLPSKKVIIYHNITPSEFFLPFSAEMARISYLGRQELKSLAPHVDLSLADSEFNRLELESMGFKETHSFSLFIDFEKYKTPMDAFLHGLFRDERTNILFVGRIVPNKKIEDLIKVTFYFKKYISPLVRLIVVGKIGSLPQYYRSLVRMADEFYLKSEEIRFTGHVSDSELYALYRASDVFLSMSEHEGFCLPLVESMLFDLPIVAFKSSAVPYTLGGSGVLISRKKVDDIGELVNIVAHDKNLRRAVVRTQRRRLAEFQKTGREEFLLSQLEKLGK